jgi:hypothetical protein
MGRSPISTIGLGRTPVSSASLVPNPPARMTTFILQFTLITHARTKRQWRY